MALITEPLSKAEVTLIQIADKLHAQEVAKLDEGRKAVLQSVHDSHGILPGTSVQFAQVGPGEFVLAYERADPSTGKDETPEHISLPEAEAIATKALTKRRPRLRRTA